MLCFTIRKVLLTFLQDILSCFSSSFLCGGKCWNWSMPGIGAIDSPALGMGVCQNDASSFFTNKAPTFTSQGFVMSKRFCTFRH